MGEQRLDAVKGGCDQSQKERGKLMECRNFDPANYLTDVETAVFYLQDAAQDADPDALRQAVEDVARALGSVAVASTKG